ncbi:MAG TPA: transglutaminase domain-containing protein [Jatrophihabitans sp.]|jgi:hypothetical protein
MRRVIQRGVLPLTLIASLLSATPWLRSFPADVMLGPLFGAAVLSVLLPVVFGRMGVRSLWATALLDIVVFVLYELIVVLHDPSGIHALLSGVYRGPSQVLSYALPLLSPRSLMVSPIALTWIVGAVAGECVARRWTAPVMHGGFLVSFALAYAATVRGTSTVSDALLRREAPLAAVLLLALMLLRAAQTWTQQDSDAEATQADGVLPLRGVYAGSAIAVVVAFIAYAIAQNTAPSAEPTTPQREPAVNSSEPVSPVSFIAGLRPASQSTPGTDLFTVRTDGASTGYLEIANLDYYDGSGWSFDRTFRPSGGVLQPDTDTSLAGSSGTVTQTYRLGSSALVGKPWMPYLYRAEKVDGIGVSTDTGSGMIVPARSLAAGESFAVRSTAPVHTFTSVPATASPDTLTATTNVQLPGSLNATLSTVVSTFSQEIGVPSTPALPFLAALQRQLQQNYSLPGAATTTAAAPSPSPTVSPSGAPTAMPVSSPAPPGARAGSTSFADVAASILGANRSGTPEQYATLVALVARELGVPARIATGFRVPTSGGVLAAGSYTVTTKDAWTWVEIPVMGEGWVVLDAAPGQYGNAPVQPTEGATTAPVPTATPTQDSAVISKGDGNAVAPHSSVPSGHSSTGLIVLIVIVAVVALVILGVIGWLMRKPLRVRRRRRAADPRTQVLGAWAESIDLLSESGLFDLDVLTSAEIASVAAERFGASGGSAARFLGAQANVAVYSPRTALAERDAEDAWEAHRLLRTEIRRGLTQRERLATRFRYRKHG